jgi:ParB/RepB/Spo0J family partition protein
MADLREVDSIIAWDRHRKDLGDLAPLARSIEDVGLLHPIVVRSDGLLIAGERRLRACQKLEWDKVPVTVIDLEEIVRGEIAENRDRKDFLPSEIGAIRRAMEPLEREAAKQRMSEGGGDQINDRVAKVSLPGRTLDKIGAFAGVSGRTVEKIAKVIFAAEADPERFGDLVDQKDKSGRVNAAYSKVNRAAKHQEIREKAQQAATIVGQFPLIYAGPPWKRGRFGEKDKESENGKGRTADQHYETLTYEEIEQYKIQGRTISDIASKKAVLFLWCTSANLLLALEVVKA